jgi:hypothetical protein
LPTTQSPPPVHLAPLRKPKVLIRKTKRQATDPILPRLLPRHPSNISTRSPDGCHSIPAEYAERITMDPTNPLQISSDHNQGPEEFVTSSRQELEEADKRGDRKTVQTEWRSWFGSILCH